MSMRLPPGAVLCALRLMRAMLFAAAISPAALTSAWGESPVTEVLQHVGIEQRLAAQVPLELQFRDESGQPVRLQKYFAAKPVVLQLVYFECPMLCNQVLNGFLHSSQAIPFEIGRDYEVLTVS